MIPRRRPALGLPAIVGAAISIALIAFGFAAASADPFSVIADFNVVLQPNVLHGFLLGTVSGARGYVVEVSPLEPAVAGARVTALTEPEFHGPSGIWFDVARVLLQGASAPLHVNIRIYATAAAPVISDSNVTLQPAVPHAFSLGNSAVGRGYVVEVTPLQTTIGDGASVVAVVRPESTGTAWNDVARATVLNAHSPFDANIRVYAVTAPIVEDVEMTLEPGVPEGVSLGNSAAKRGYVVEVTPLEPTAAGAYVTASEQPEFDGTAWNDVVRLQLFNASGPVNANVRVYAAGEPAGVEGPLVSVGQAHFWLSDLAGDRLIERATFTPPADYDPASQPLEMSLADPACGGVFARILLPAGSFAMFQGGNVLQFRGTTINTVTGNVLTALLRLVRQSGATVLLTMDVETADFTCLHGSDSRTITTTLSVGAAELAGVQSFRRLSDGGLFFP